MEFEYNHGGDSGWSILLQQESERANKAEKRVQQLENEKAALKLEHTKLHRNMVKERQLFAEDKEKTANKIKAVQERNNDLVDQVDTLRTAKRDSEAKLANAEKTIQKLLRPQVTHNNKRSSE